MKKIGILTINDYTNYGNRLQNYASQEVLNALGFQVETIINTTMHLESNNEGTFKLQRLNKLRNYSAIELINKMKFKIFSLRNSKKIIIAKKEKRKNFIEFTKHNIKETKYTISDNNIPNDLTVEYDFFVTGSDQVWNPNFERFSGVDFLSFAPKYKRIAYAPSFGISELPTENKKLYKEWLSEMSSVSVREQAGAKIIKELTGRDAEVLIDPTLMLTKEQWLSIAMESEFKPKKKYILTYFLGNQTSENRKSIKRIAQINDLDIVNLADIYDIKRYTADPSEFIDYINSASLVLTDSFHGAVFSTLLKTPFVVYNREGSLPSMNSRIDTLTSKFKLESRKAENIEKNEQILNADYSHVDEILQFEREKALIYLKNALDVK
ncbi:polysaccharide pyruvyl transferase family protein [Sporosarcina sp. A2]|uniref:polysaccharide pyruvyl transferase family protein n=1 Tax=Sporosarcina sp. A2 TaxID=3393449 RepID=UPI003D7BDEF3